MKTSANKTLIAGLGLLAITAPLIFSAYTTQLAFLWVMVIFALTWDIMGGQMGYNSFGNIVFFGVGMYTCAVIQRDSGLGYFQALLLGILIGMILSVILAYIMGIGILGLRGHYFSIATLGLGYAFGELASGWDYVGAGSGMVTPLFPGEIETRNIFYYTLFIIIALLNFGVFKWLYAGKFGQALNAIRDDEDKAEAMGLHTTRYKVMAWCFSAIFLSITGACVGNLLGFIDPREVAFASPTFGLWMILMAIIGGSGTLWGPVIGAFIYHLTQELFWTYLLGWQRVALGILIVVIVIFFPTGIMGFLRKTWPEKFGEEVEIATVAAESE